MEYTREFKKLLKELPTAAIDEDDEELTYVEDLFPEIKIVKFTSIIRKNISGLSLDTVAFAGCTFRNCKIEYTLFQSCQFLNCTFENCFIKSNTFLTTTFNETNFIDCEFHSAQFNGCEILQSKCQKCNFFPGTHFASSLFSNSIFSASHFVEVGFSASSVITPEGHYKVDFQECTLYDCNFSQVNLTDTKFTKCDFTTNLFIECNLSKNTIQKSYLSESYLYCKMDLDTLKISEDLPSNTLKKIFGIEIPDVQTIIKENVSTVDFHSVFISYSFQDYKFALKLNEALLSKGIKTFFWQRNAPAGRRLKDIMASNIKTYDKLLFVASKDSLKSEACQFELQEARKKYYKNWGNIFIPIHIDDYLFSIQDFNIPIKHRTLFWENITELKEFHSIDFSKFSSITKSNVREFSKKVDLLVKELRKNESN